MARKRSSSATTEAAAEALPLQSTEAQAPPALPVRHDLVDPTVPTGMVRINNGSEQRFIWPVHLSGWQQQGWTLIAAASGVQITPAPTAPEPVIDAPAPAAAPTPEPSASEPTPEIDESGAATSWEVETSAPGDELQFDDPLL
ncbi:MAG: hypothetical protein VKM92_06360 [Cyanobacteriota bacterium]|nr:hypothetical protein [Cyanobacteriota bacterium]